MGIPEPRRNTRSPLGLGLRLYFLSPLEIGTGLGKPELIWFGFGEVKIRPRPVAMPNSKSKRGINLNKENINTLSYIL
jgi:hypothetical protein